MPRRCAQDAHPGLAGEFGPQRRDLAIRQAVGLTTSQQVLVEHGRVAAALAQRTRPAIWSTNQGSTPEASGHLLDGGA